MFAGLLTGFQGYAEGRFSVSQGLLSTAASLLSIFSPPPAFFPLWIGQKPIKPGTMHFEWLTLQCHMKQFPLRPSQECGHGALLISLSRQRLCKAVRQMDVRGNRARHQ